MRRSLLCDVWLVGAPRHLLGPREPWTLGRDDGRAAWSFCSWRCVEAFLVATAGRAVVVAAGRV